jgi:type IV secretory pathway VirB4 component
LWSPGGGYRIKRLKLFKKRSRHEAEDILARGVPSLQELIGPDGLEEFSDRLLAGPSQYVRIFALATYPRFIHLGWLNAVFSLGEVDLSVHIDPASDRDVVTALTRRVVNLEAQCIVETNRGSITRLHILRQAVRDLEALRAAVQTNLDRLFFVTVLIAVYGNSESDLNRRCDRLENILARLAAQGRALLFRQIGGFGGVLAAATPPAGFERSLSTGGVQAVLPVTGNTFTHSTGVFLGLASDQTPVFYDAFLGPPALMNPHVAVFGPPGSGKSVTLKVYAGRLALNDVRVIIMDCEREYRKAAAGLYDGQTVTVAPGKAAGINPLELEPEIDPDTERESVNISEKVADIRALVATVVQGFAGRNPGAREISTLEEVVREEYTVRGITSDPDSLYLPPGTKHEGGYAVGRVKKRMPTLSDIHGRLEQKPGMDELSTILKICLRGNSLGMFDCETAINLNSRATVFDLHDIRDDFARLYAMFVVLTWTWHQFVLKHEGKKAILIDEAWTFVKYPAAAKHMEIFARRGRKRKVSLVIASQFIEEFLAREEGRAVVASCETLMLMRQSPTIVDQVVEAFRLPSGAAGILTGAQPGECLLRVGGVLATLRVHPLDHEWPHVGTG